VTKFLASARADQISLFLIFGILIALLLNGMSHGADFQVFYLAGERLLKGLSIYQADDGWMPFKYHPAWAAFFSLFALIPEKASIVVFNCLQMAIWYWLVRIWAGWLGYEMKRPLHYLYLLILALSAFSAETGYGQVNGALFLGSTLLVYLLESEPKRPLTAGFLFAIIFTLKLNFGILLIYCAIKSWRTLMGFALGLLALHFLVAIANLSLLSESVYRGWIDLLLTQSASQYYMFEAQGFLRFFHSIVGDAGKTVWVIAMALFLLGGLLLHRQKREMPLIAIYWITGTYLFSPLAWWYQVLYMYPIVFLLFKQPLTNWERRLVQVCLFVYAAVTFNTLGRQGIIVFKEWQGFFYCSAILYALFLARVYKRVPFILSSSLSSSRRIS
jgi:hypothetical protein